MPAFPALTTQQRADLVAMLFGDPPKPDDAPDPDEPEPSVPYTMTGYNRFLDPDGYPAVKPPWGTLNAIDLNKGEIAWQVPLGELPELVEAWPAEDGHRELRRPDRHRRRPDLHRRDEGREVPSLRQAHRTDALGGVSCPPAATRRRRPTRSAASSTSSSEPAAARWARSPAMRTSRTRCRTTSAVLQCVSAAVLQCRSAPVL